MNKQINNSEESKANRGRPKGSPNKSTQLARDAIAKFADANAERMQEWLDEVAADPNHGPKVAFSMLMDVMEYHIPKLARTEHTGEGGGPVVIMATNLDENI